MKKTFSFLLTMATIFSSLACGNHDGSGFLPANDLQIPAGIKTTSELQEIETINMLKRLENQFKPFAQSYGANLVIKFDWNNSEVNAFASRPEPKTYQITMTGGFARFPGMTYDAYTMVFCHELGHHFAGAPLKQNSWASAEGQSDYWGAMKCLRRVFGAEDNNRKLLGKFISAEVKRNCDLVYLNDNDRKVCYRISMTAHKLTNLMNQMQNIVGGTDFISPNTRIVETTVLTHPDNQCRLDTYFQGILCDKDFKDKTSESDYRQGTCTAESGFRLGVRPRCWFKSE